MKEYRLSELKQVPEADRVKGRVYGVSDLINEGLEYVAIFKTGNNSIIDYTWNYWFELPEDLLPVREVLVKELPDEFELNAWEWEYLDKSGNYTHIPMTTKFRRIKPLLPELTIPAGTKGEQLEYLRGVIATFEGGGCNKERSRFSSKNDGCAELMDVRTHVLRVELG
jgi:hypothetical protein